jgi:large-conductance mechanosensitive channel
MEALFYVVPLLMIGVAVFMLVKVVRRSQDMRSAWSSGLTAEARCLRTYTTTSGGGDTMVSTTLHHVYEFTTREGRSVRFEEGNGPATVVEGDLVTVHYAAEWPERATAHAPARGRLAAESGCLAAFLGVFIAGCVIFMVVVHVIFSAVDTFLP